ncbi:MAG: M48 family metalloprotease [Gammaproteobacteria bacterium]
MKFSNILLTLALSLLLSPAPVHADVRQQDLPDLGDSSGSVISPEMERRIGQLFLRNVREHANIVTDPEVQSYIHSLGYRLAANSDNNAQNYTFFMVDDPMVNAFAAPGGVIGINTGIILNSESESEIAGVVAHEIAHVTQRHLARMFERQQQLALPMLAALIGAVALTIVNPQAGQAAMTAVAAGQAQYGINFTRANEEEADRIGMQILARSGFSPRGMADFFERLHRTSRYYAGNAPEYLRTHPLTSNRIADARSRAENYPDIEVKNTGSYELIRMKLMATGQKSEADALKLFREKMQNAKPDQITATRYGLTIALIRAGEFSEARLHVDKLLEQDNEKAAFMLLAAELENAQRNYDRSVDIYERMHKLYPYYRPLVLAHARTLLAMKRGTEARTLLRDYGRTNTTDHQYYELLSQAEAQAGNEAESGIARAEQFFLLGDTSLAIERLKYTERQPGINYYQQQRISARIKHFENELALERELLF